MNNSIGFEYVLPLCVVFGVEKLKITLIGSAYLLFYEIRIILKYDNTKHQKSILMSDTPISGDTDMTLVKLRRAAQITLPLEIRQAARIKEGDYLEAEVTKSGILLRPVSVDRREPTAAQEAEIYATVEEERKNYTAQRRR